MKKIVFITGSIGVLAVVLIAGRMLFIPKAEPVSAPVAGQALSASKTASATIEGASANRSSGITAATKADLTADQASMLAQKIMAAMTGGGSAAKVAALDPASLWDTSLSLKVRRQLAWRLARSDDPADFKLLTDYLMSAEGDSSIKALLVESLGESPHPKARDWILSALNADDEQMVCSALRGLAKMDNLDDVKLFTDLLLSSATPGGIRAEAALALGALSAPEAGTLLMTAYNAADPDDDVLREALINGLGRRDIAETESFFRQLLTTKTDAESRIRIIEAVSAAQGDTAPFLLDYLNDADNDVRAEAAWNIGMLDGDHGAALSERLRTESDPDVRQRLYEALDGQENINVPLVLERSLLEGDVDVQLAAYSLVAANLNRIEDPAERYSAELELVHEFERMAVESGTLNQHLRAVIGLRRMDTEASDVALVRIISQSTDPRVITATDIDLEELLQSLSQ